MLGSYISLISKLLLVPTTFHFETKKQITEKTTEKDGMWENRSGTIESKLVYTMSSFVQQQNQSRELIE
jgi:hypothetical protein